jgi:hypothetical protein
MEQGNPTALRRDTNGARPFREILDAVDQGLEAERQAGPQEVETPANTLPSATDILDERQKTHGEFGDNARVSQALKRAFRAELGWDLLTDTERESMDMIALKFSRVLSGKPLQLQHWEDVVGYARLAEKLCK